MSAEDDRVPISPDPAMHWKRWEEWLDLIYEGTPVIRIHAQEDGTVLIRTRAYSEGPTVHRRMATEAGALRYANAWLLKWHGLAKTEINNKIKSAQLEIAAAAAARANYPELDPATFTKRRRRR
ncbi:hypothetical protein Xtri_13645 [Xanthomonas campestris pv. trichodesmae]|uniref:Uncharacterized protein n=2 Tax=Xanthomonas citri TaxID=346 RepID=A0AB33CJY3_XANCI|nr:hypothetical protein XcvCFBP7111P_14945 [Xanthomonas citri pv. vignicola]MBZ3920452.1 hypothetical protein [Xanthomonas campestris pv. trichodesmae]MBZ3923779.1 hypothetical protein [Xanthomonas citri pv. sesbaniae]